MIYKLTDIYYDQWYEFCLGVFYIIYYNVLACMNNNYNIWVGQDKDWFF
jgi:hypothetical protein